MKVPEFLKMEYIVSFFVLYFFILIASHCLTSYQYYAENVEQKIKAFRYLCNKFSEGPQHRKTNISRSRTFKDVRKMDKELFWILYGVVLAFGIQVVYDAIGLFTNPTWKAGIGIIIYIISAVALVLFGRKTKK